MPNPTLPLTRVNALAADDGLADIELRSTLRFLDADDKAAFVAHLGVGGGGITALAPAATVNIDFAGAPVQTLALDQDTTLTTSNLAAGRSVKVRISTTVSRLIAIPAGWVFIGNRLGGLPAGEAVELTLLSTGTTDAGVQASLIASTWTPYDLPSLAIATITLPGYCYTDDGTTLATPGQAVYRTKNPSPANYLVQTDAARRPTLRARGLEFGAYSGDANDDRMLRSSYPYMNFGGSDFTLYFVLDYNSALSSTSAAIFGSTGLSCLVALYGDVYLFDTTGNAIQIGHLSDDAQYLFRVVRKSSNLSFAMFVSGPAVFGGVAGSAANSPITNNVSFEWVGHDDSNTLGGDPGILLQALVVLNGIAVPHSSVLDMRVMDYLRLHTGVITGPYDNPY